MANRIAVISVGLYGHINPTLAVTQELVHKGHSVFYYATSPFKSVIEATGAAYRAYASRLEEILSETACVESELSAVIIKECHYVLPELLPVVAADAPEVIVYDMVTLAGQLVADILRIPSIRFYPSYVATQSYCYNYASLAAKGLHLDEESLAMFDFGIKQFAGQFGFQPFDYDAWMTHAAPLNIVCMPRCFQVQGETFDHRFEFVGPCFYPPPNTTLKLGFKEFSRPLLYISLGTLFNQWTEFFKICLQAFGETHWNAMIVCGGYCHVEDFGELPDNVILERYVDQLGVLQQADLFITHGGMNSAMEALYFGVPQVVIPQAVDQQETALRLDQLGLGVHLPKAEVTVATLIQAAEKAVKLPREKITTMQSNVKAAGGYQRATELIDQFAIAKTHCFSNDQL